MNINLELSNKNQSEIVLHLCHHKAVLTKKKKPTKNTYMPNEVYQKSRYTEKTAYLAPNN